MCSKPTNQATLPAMDTMKISTEEMQAACGMDGSLKTTVALIEKHGAAAVAAWRSTTYGWTALHCAVQNSHDGDVLRALICAGLDVNVVAEVKRRKHARVMSLNSPKTVLHLAKTAEQVRVLTAAGASLSARTLSGYTSLHIACEYGHVEAALEMLNASSGIPRVVLAKDNDGDTARDVASLNGHAELLPVLDKAMREAEVSAF